jgi:hypothetical protein
VSPGRKTSIARSANAGTATLTGSLIAMAPAAMVVDGLPPKVSGRAEAGTIDASFWRNAMLAAPTGRGAVPNTLLSTTRTRSPPRLVWTIWRRVCRLKLSTGGPGAGAGAAACGRATTAVAHVPTQ